MVPDAPSRLSSRCFVKLGGNRLRDGAGDNIDATGGGGPRTSQDQLDLPCRPCLRFGPYRPEGKSHDDCRPESPPHSSFLQRKCEPFEHSLTAACTPNNLRCFYAGEHMGSRQQGHCRTGSQCRTNKSQVRRAMQKRKLQTLELRLRAESHASPKIRISWRQRPSSRELTHGMSGVFR